METETVERVEKTGKAAWGRWMILAGLTAWFAYDLVRTLLYAVESWGLPGAFDAMVLLRLGELLAFVPLAVYLLAVAKNTAFFRRARWVMAAGALLSGVSYFGLQGRIAWAPLALLVAFLALLAALVSGVRRGRAAKLLPWFGFGYLILMHLLVDLSGLLFHGYAVVPYPAPYPAQAETAAEQRQADARYLGSELARLHKNAFHTMTEPEYWDELARLEASAPALSDAQFNLEMMRFVASVGDAHTSLLLGDAAGLHSLPLIFRWFGPDLHVHAASDDYAHILGARVVAIGSLPAEDVYQAVLPYISHENDAWARVQSRQYLHIVELLAQAGAVDGVGPVALTVENQSQETITLDVVPLEPGEQVDFQTARQEQPYYLSQPDLPFWYEYRPESRTLYFRYAACVDPLGFYQTANEFWKIVEEQPVDRLIFDLRDNGGGNTFQFDQFFWPRLWDHPELNDPQRLFVLIDGVTFSSASKHAVDFAERTSATLVGEPTGGKPNGYGEVRSFRLPYSRAQVFYSTNYFQTMPEDPPSVMPDVLIYAPAEAIYSGQDPVLETAAPDEDW